MLVGRTLERLWATRYPGPLFGRWRRCGLGHSTIIWNVLLTVRVFHRINPTALFLGFSK